VILLVVAAFIAGYLIGRAGPTVVAAEEGNLATDLMETPAAQAPQNG
jgi:hypothetical protein